MNPEHITLFLVKILFNIILSLLLCLSSYLTPQLSFAFLNPSMRATCPDHLILSNIDSHNSI